MEGAGERAQWIKWGSLHPHKKLGACVAAVMYPLIPMLGGEARGFLGLEFLSQHYHLVLLQPQ